jgi:undecaprenyl diphosphate synthase
MEKEPVSWLFFRSMTWNTGGKKMNVPNHVAIILDGNGRWAKAKGMPRSYGHVKGCANLETI